MKNIKIKPMFNRVNPPKIGLITLASDYIIEKDFHNVIKNKNINLFVNRIECYNPLNRENLIKMSQNITKVTKNILPGEELTLNYIINKLDNPLWEFEYEISQ